MNQPIGPGDWVECVDAANLRFMGLVPTRIPSRLTKGAIYQVSDVWSERLLGLTVQLCALVGRPLDTYGQRRFRPVYSPKSDFIEKLKQPAPTREPENA